MTEVDYQLFVMLKRKVEEQNLHAKRIMACPCAYSDGTSRCSDLERAKGSMARKCRCTWQISQTSKCTGTGKESLTRVTRGAVTSPVYMDMCTLEKRPHIYTSLV